MRPRGAAPHLAPLPRAEPTGRDLVGSGSRATGAGRTRLEQRRARRVPAWPGPGQAGGGRDRPTVHAGTQGPLDMHGQTPRSTNVTRAASNHESTLHSRSGYVMDTEVIGTRSPESAHRCTLRIDTTQTHKPACTHLAAKGDVSAHSDHPSVTLCSTAGRGPAWSPQQAQPWPGTQPWSSVPLTKVVGAPRWGAPAACVAEGSSPNLRA